MAAEPIVEERVVLTAKEAAHYIRMSRSWLWASDIPRVRMGRRVTWLREDLDAYLRAHRTHGGATQ